GGRASLGQLARSERHFVPVVGDLVGREMDIAGPHLARRRRSQRSVLADYGLDSAAPAARRLLRADRESRRHARDDALQALDVHIRPHAGFSEALCSGKETPLILFDIMSPTSPRRVVAALAFL